MSPPRSKKRTLKETFFWNRQKGHEEVELVYGDRAVNWLYGSAMGQTLADRALSRARFSQIYGLYQSSPMSRLKIQPFIKKFKIPMEEYAEGPFRNFNEFFIREFKKGARPFVQDEKQMAAFAEARYLAYERITEDQKFPVKGSFLSAKALLSHEDYDRTFHDGPILIARLCPTDYHRFHFPDEGEADHSYALRGRLHSVNPLALQYKNDIFSTNERQVTILKTKNFGKLAYIEVGAICVGKIVQTHKGKQFQRGDEKGYFLFGASTVIVLGEPGAWKPSQDLLTQSAMGRETLVRLGEPVAVAG